jgi:hypothetical protein
MDHVGGHHVHHVQVLKVTAGQVVVGSDGDLAVALLLDHNIVAQVVGAALNLDAVLEELLESGDIEDLVIGRLGGVDDELKRNATLARELSRRLRDPLPN